MTHHDQHGPLPIAFRLLASAELNCPTSWLGSHIESMLRARVTTLAELMDILPAARMSEVEQLAAHWEEQFAFRPTVSLDEIRRSARDWLQRDRIKQRPQGIDVQQIRRWLALDQLNLEEFEAARREPEFTREAKQACVQALLRWQTELQENPQWCKTDGMAPVDEPVRLQDVFVEVFARRRTRQDLESLPMRCERVGATPMLIDPTPAVRVQQILTAQTRHCLLLGEPGAGKTTLVQWLAWATHNKLLPDFELALVVRLSDFVKHLEHQPRDSILDFWIESLLEPHERCRDAAACLRDAANKSGKFLLLIDGWDEVPMHLRKTVETAIRQESGVFYSVVTSRLAGLPWQIFDQADLFELSRLEPAAIRRFVIARTASLGRAEPTANAVIKEIESNSDFTSLASNPFLLGMLTRLLMKVHDSQVKPSSTRVHQQICAWMMDHSKQATDDRSQLGFAHMRSLEKLAFCVSVEATEQSYEFADDEIDLGSALPRALERSRFLHRVSGLTNTRSFLRPSLQHFFAAKYLSRLSDDVVQPNLKQLLFSQRRRPTLCFYSGLNHQTNALTARITKASLEEPDRFDGLTGWVTELDRAAADALNPSVVGFVPKAHCTPALATDTKPVSAGHCLTLLQAVDPTCPNGTHETARLLEILESQFNSLPDETLMRLLLDRDDSFPFWVLSRLRNRAVAEISMTNEGGRRISPALRDRLLRRLAVLEYGDSRLPFLLRSLIGYPIGTGTCFVAQLAGDRQLQPAYRILACQVLQSTQDRNTVRRLVESIPLERVDEVIDWIIRLSIKHAIPLPPPWLQKKLRPDQPAWSNGATKPVVKMRLVRAVLEQAAVADTAQLREQQTRWIEPLINSALDLSAQRYGPRPSELAVLLAEMVGLAKRIRWSTSLMRRAQALLATNQPFNVGLPQRALAFELVCHQSDSLGVTTTLLNELRKELRTCREPESRRDLEAFIMRVATVLGNTSLSKLMRFPRGIRCVEEGLQRVASLAGILVFATRAYDAEGRCVVDLDRSLRGGGVNGNSTDANQMTWSSLPPMQLRALKSFQIVTRYIGPTATFEQIHAAIDSRSSCFPSSVREDLDDLYDDVEFPRLTAWRRSLNHAARKLRDSNEGKDLLRELGLPRR